MAARCAKMLVITGLQSQNWKPVRQAQLEIIFIQRMCYAFHPCQGLSSQAWDREVANCLNSIQIHNIGWRTGCFGLVLKMQTNSDELDSTTGSSEAQMLVRSN